MSEINKNLPSYGVWEIKTESGVTRGALENVGTYIGYLDDILFALADRFHPTAHVQRVNDSSFDGYKKATSVQVTFDYPQHTNCEEERLEFAKQIFAGRPGIAVEDGCFLGSVKIIDSNLIEKRKAALAKLTMEEIEILGLGKKF